MLVKRARQQWSCPHFTLSFQYSPAVVTDSFCLHTSAVDIHFSRVCPWREVGDVWCSVLSGISGLSFDSPFLSPFLFFYLVLLLFLSCHFSANCPFSWLLSPKFFLFPFFKKIKRWSFLLLVWLLLTAIIIIIHSFYIALFSAPEQTHCTHWHVIPS